MLQSKSRLLELNAKLAETLTDKGVTATADETTTALIDKVKNISGSEKLIEFSQVRSEVQSYIDNVTYDSTDYTTSQIADYVTTSTSNNQPVGCPINLKSAGTLIVYDSASGGSAVTNSVAGDNYIYNVTPNAVCHYVNIVDGNIDQSGTLKATGACRMIKSASAPNVRDLGGWQCDGGTVKYGKLFRGGVLSDSDKDVMVNQLRIRHDLDLRGISESGGITSSPLGNAVNYTCTNKFVWYALDNTDDWTLILSTIFNAVSKNEPLYFHCSAGADRTGTVACVVEAILGVSQSDIDKEYELTCFYTGVDTDNKARRRNESDWTGLINEINNYSGDSFRDKVVSWVLSLGFSIDTINQFRQTMINGTPETLLFSGDIYTISTNIDNASLSNTDTSANQYSQYYADVKPDNGYIISDISIMMGGKDITSTAFRGIKTSFNFSVANNLVNCSTNNVRKSVISNQSYGAMIIADDGYTLKNADVNIKMGGIDMSEYYSDGTIVIPVVTGNIEINITAQKSADSYTNQILSSTDNDGDIVGLITGHRYNSSDTLVEMDGKSCCGFIPISNGDIVRFKNINFGAVADGTIYLRFYNDNFEIVDNSDQVITPYQLINNNRPTNWSYMTNIKYDTDGNICQFVNESELNYIRLSWGNTTDTPIITINEEIN